MSFVIRGAIFLINLKVMTIRTTYKTTFQKMTAYVSQNRDNDNICVAHSCHAVSQRVISG